MVSVIMGVYNGGSTLREALDSILNQTYSNWELIACNDCSTDNSAQILQEYAKREDAYLLEDVEECLYKDGDMSGYLFKCIHCNKYHLWVDAN